MSVNDKLNEHGWIMPDWPAPACVQAYSTTRSGGYSGGAYQGLNLGDHVGDSRAVVIRNRDYLSNGLKLPSGPSWLQQIHSRIAVVIEARAVAPKADGASTIEPNVVCSVLTADCLPVLFTNKKGSWVAAAHAGWRGLAAGILESTLATTDTLAEDILVWFGPAIGSEAFVVGEEVYNTFVDQDVACRQAFTAVGSKWQCDLVALARQRLSQKGLSHFFGGTWCTHQEEERFFSYRRDGQTGRMATLIWRE